MLYFETKERNISREGLTPFKTPTAQYNLLAPSASPWQCTIRAWPICLVLNSSGYAYARKRKPISE